MKTRETLSPKRAGFSIIELLVVIAIIATLVGLVVFVAVPMFFMQEKRNTTALLSKLDGTLEEQWGEAVKGFNNRVNSGAVASDLATIQSVFGPNCSLETAKVIWVKLQMKAAFPMTYQEALFPAGNNASLQSFLQARPTFANNAALLARKNAMTGVASAIDPQTESAALLVLALEQTFGGKKFSAEEALGPNALKDTDGDGLKEIIDGYGKAVFFFRWGTGNTDLDGLARGSSSRLDRDTEDREHQLMNNTWNPDATATAGVNLFQQLCHNIRGGSGRQSYFTKPVVVSAGKDGKLGLNWDMSSQGVDAQDNFYSFKVR